MKKDRYIIKGRIWISSKDGNFLGAGRIELLKKIEECGSITEAAKRMKMSYRQAWKLISSMNRQSSQPLVSSETGGHGGGGTKLTETGRKMIESYEKLQENFEKFLISQSEIIDFHSDR